jgi:hypothetical protein
VAKLFDDALVEQALVNRYAVENERVDPTQERSKLPPRADGLKQTHVLAADEGLEEPPAARANSHGSTARQRIEHELGKSRVPPFEVQQELGLRARSCEQAAQFESRRERVRKPPFVPEDRQRAGCLQMAYLEPPSPHPYISFDEGDTELLGLVKTCQVVSGAMSDDERHVWRLAVRGAQPARDDPESEKDDDHARHRIDHVVVRRYDDRGRHRSRPENRERP